MPQNQFNENVIFSMDVNVRESNLLKKIRQVKESGEFLLIVEGGKVKKVKYATIYSFDPGQKLMSFEQLAKIIKEKVPFGEVNILTRNGWPYAISTTMTYDDLSDGL